jgi:hypothetical protein
MDTRLIWFGTVLIGAVVVGAYQHQQAKQMADLHKEIESLRAELKDQASAQGQAMVAPYLAQAAAMVREAVQPASSEHTASVTPPPAQKIGPSDQTQQSNNKRGEEEARANQTAVEVAFTSEAIDRSWAPDARGELRQHLAALLPASSSLRDVDCRSSICRVEMVHANAKESGAFVQKAFMGGKDSAWNGPGMVMPVQVNSDGTVAVAVYLGRDDDSLSRVFRPQNAEGAGL